MYSYNSCITRINLENIQINFPVIFELRMVTLQWKNIAMSAPIKGEV